jgi:hypothetical protein
MNKYDRPVPSENPEHEGCSVVDKATGEFSQCCRPATSSGYCRWHTLRPPGVAGVTYHQVYHKVSD